MQEITLNEFEENFDRLIDQVEKTKKSFIISDGNKKVVLVPYTDKGCQKTDGVLEYLCNHNDGC